MPTKTITVVECSIRAKVLTPGKSQYGLCTTGNAPAPNPPTVISIVPNVPKNTAVYRRMERARFNGSSCREPSGALSPSESECSWAEREPASPRRGSCSWNLRHGRKRRESCGASGVAEVGVVIGADDTECAPILRLAMAVTSTPNNLHTLRVA